MGSVMILASLTVRGLYLYIESFLGTGLSILLNFIKYKSILFHRYLGRPGEKKFNSRKA